MGGSIRLAFTFYLWVHHDQSWPEVIWVFFVWFLFFFVWKALPSKSCDHVLQFTVILIKLTSRLVHCWLIERYVKFDEYLYIFRNLLNHKRLSHDDVVIPSGMKEKKVEFTEQATHDTQHRSRQTIKQWLTSQTYTAGKDFTVNHFPWLLCS